MTVPVLRIASVVLCACIAVACSRAPGREDASTADARPSERAAPRAGADSPDALQPVTGAAVAVDMQAQRHDAALRDAVAAVHGYLRHVGARERPQAEALWAYNRLPPPTEEAGLRALELRALRIENDTPRPLDAEAVPASIEVPVRLRATLPDGAQQRYTGWYRVRRNPVTTRWELTGVSLTPTLQ